MIREYAHRDHACVSGNTPLQQYRRKNSPSHAGGAWMLAEDAEAIAQMALDESGLDDRPRADPRVLARSYCGLTLMPWPGCAPRLVGDVLWYPSDVGDDAQAYYVAHEAGHFLACAAGYQQHTEQAASRVGVALLLPKRSYRRDLFAAGLDLAQLTQLWPLASAWVHARRITEVLEGRAASRWRRGRCVERVGAGKASAAERELGNSDRPIAEGGSCAWPLEDSTIVVYEVA